MVLLRYGDAICPDHMTESGMHEIERMQRGTGASRVPIPRVSSGRRLLILACSERKIPTCVPQPALQRYDGPAFRVLRRYLRKGPVSSLAIYILSAAYGLIGSEVAIADYDRRMTAQRANELRPATVAKLQTILQQGRFREVFICAGRTYRIALTGIDQCGTPVCWATRGLGGRLTELRDWLREPVQ
jgi:hypothetical protein